MNYRCLYVCALGALGSSSAAWAGPDWVERGDAGPNASSAQPVLGIGQLVSIEGSLSPPSLALVPADYEDMYLIRITAPTVFSITTFGANFNAKLYLFNLTKPGEAFGLLANDDTVLSNLPQLVSPATDGTGAAATQPGVYLLGVCGFGRDPVSANGNIFHLASPTEVSGPDGPGGINPHTDWTGVGQTGTYLLTVTGVDFYDTPAPGGAALLAGGLALFARRRRT